MIAKKLHFIWFGGTPLSDDYLAHITQWMTLNPDYSTHIWVSSDDNIADITARLLSHSTPDSPPVFVKNISERGLIFRNFDILLELLELGATLAAVDIAKIDLMVHEGGVYADLGIRPQKSLADHIHPTDRSLCDLDSPQCFQKITWGQYHFHASETDGLIYTRTQRIQRYVYKASKNLDIFRKVFTNPNPFIKYKATIALTGCAVFVAIDCIRHEYGDTLAWIRPLAVSELGLKKPVKPRPNTENDLHYRTEFKSIILPIYQDMRNAAANIDHPRKISPCEKASQLINKARHFFTAAYNVATGNSVTIKKNIANNTHCYPTKTSSYIR